MSDLGLRPLFTWRGAICDSDLPPTARLVALVLSLHMNERGGSCFPSQATLVAETGLSERCIRDQLALLESAGWLERTLVRRGRGKGSRVYYEARVPVDNSPDTPAPVAGGQLRPANDDTYTGTGVPVRGRHEDVNPPTPQRGKRRKRRNEPTGNQREVRHYDVGLPTAEWVAQRYGVSLEP